MTLTELIIRLSQHQTPSKLRHVRVQTPQGQLLRIKTTALDEKGNTPVILITEEDK